MKKKKLKSEVVQILSSNQFLKFAESEIEQFKNTNGYGRWLAEYDKMQYLGMLTPHSIKKSYSKILDESSTLSYIYKDAVNYIGSRAFDKAKIEIESGLYEIRVITGEIAESEAGRKLRNLTLAEASKICDTLNKEAEEHLFNVRSISK